MHLEEVGVLEAEAVQAVQAEAEEQEVMEVQVRSAEAEAEAEADPVHIQEEVAEHMGAMAEMGAEEIHRVRDSQEVWE